MKNKTLIGVAGATVSVVALTMFSLKANKTDTETPSKMPLEKRISTADVHVFSSSSAQNFLEEASPRKYTTLFDFSGNITGIPLPAFPPAVRTGSELERGCVVEIGNVTAERLVDTEHNKDITFQTPLGRLTGVVNLVKAEDGWVRIGGNLDSHSGMFFVSSNNEKVSGAVILPELGRGYEIVQEENSKVYLVERRIADLRCFSLPPKPERAVTTTTTATVETVGTVPVVPLYSSKPDAPAVIYIDLDGETVTDPSWNAGRPIVALPPVLTSSQILEIWNRVKEDFAPFNVDVTTNFARYSAVPPNRRTRCIVTPTDTAAPKAGGVAYVDSFSRSGGYFSPTIPCWVFNKTVSGIAEAISHEVGHTLGLFHDGRTSPKEAYYAGNYTWAPIMGASYSAAVTHWSKGEYLFADNKQDDLMTIAKAANGINFLPDDYGNTIETAFPLTNGTLNTFGSIGYNDVDVFKLSLVPGSARIRVSPSATISPNLDVKIELLNAVGAVLVSQAPTNTMFADIAYQIPAAGVYFLRVSGSGSGDPMTGGYSSYGSLGGYSITGTVPAAK
jgi:hypothetical protein